MATETVYDPPTPPGNYPAIIANYPPAGQFEYRFKLRSDAIDGSYSGTSARNKFRVEMWRHGDTSDGGEAVVSVSDWITCTTPVNATTGSLGTPVLSGGSAWVGDSRRAEKSREERWEDSSSNQVRIYTFVCWVIVKVTSQSSLLVELNGGDSGGAIIAGHVIVATYDGETLLGQEIKSPDNHDKSAAATVAASIGNVTP